ncbi:3-dehydrosphinganine reductase, partial [Tulasnella sp. 408]
MGWFTPDWNPDGKHCYVTGGSSGLGLAVAIELVKRGANVSIVARTERTLKDALRTLETRRVSPGQKLAYYSYSLDTATGAKEALDAACAPFKGQVPDAAFLVAGASTPKFFVEMDEADLRNGMDDGYSDTLRNECLLYGTDVHIFLAGTMKTPGYEADDVLNSGEMKAKPKISVDIEGEEGYSVEGSARKMLSGVSAGQAHIAYDLNTHLFRVTTRGSAPSHNNLLTEIVLTLIGF